MSDRPVWDSSHADELHREEADERRYRHLPLASVEPELPEPEDDWPADDEDDFDDSDLDDDDAPDDSDLEDEDSDP